MCLAASVVVRSTERRGFGISTQQKQLVYSRPEIHMSSCTLDFEIVGHAFLGSVKHTSYALGVLPSAEQYKFCIPGLKTGAIARKEHH